MTHADNPGVRFPPPLIFLLSIGLGWLGDRLLSLSAIDLPSAIRWTLAGVFAAAALILLGEALRRFRRAGTRPEPWESTSAIVHSGVYGFTRNPMYLGMTLLQLSIAMALASIGILATAVGSLVIVDRFVITREEGYLERKFGNDYRAYKARVRRWL